MPKAVVTLEEGLQTKIDIRQFEFISDEPIEDGGDDAGPKPTELLLSSVGACITITMKLYAQRKGWDLKSVKVALELEKLNPAQYPDYASSAPMLHVIRKQYTIEGDLTDDQKARLIEIGSKCPVSRVLQNPVIFEDSLLEPAQS